MKTIQETIDFLQTHCEKLNVDSYQIRLDNAKTFGGTVRKQTIVNIEDAVDHHLSIVLYKNDRRSVANSYCVEHSVMLKVIQNAYALLPFLESDASYTLPQKNQLAWDYKDSKGVFHPNQLSVEKAINLAKNCEQAAWDYSSEIFNSEGVSFSAAFEEKAIANSLGFKGFLQRTHYGLDCCVLAKDQNSNMQYGFEHTQATSTEGLLEAKLIGGKAAQYACDMLGAKNIKTQQAPVILKADVAKSLISHLLEAISGSAQHRKESFLLDAIGKKCMPDYVSIVENPTLEKSLFSQPFDAEGVKTHLKKIVEKGKLSTYLLDTYYANKLNLKTSANSGGVFNIQCLFDELYTVDSLDALCQKMNTGFLVTRLMGDGFQLATGHYSTGALGFWVEDGQIQYPVEGTTIAGNLKTILMNMQCMSCDILHASNIQIGSILLDNLSISSH